jgi:beta-lactamase superfamily II metal-dependent hydrolase
VGDLLVDCAGLVAAWMLPLLGHAARWSSATWLGEMTLHQLALTVIALLCCLLPLRPSMRIAALVLALSGFAVTGRLPDPGRAELAILGAGAGTSVIVTTASNRLVFGTGEVHGGDGRRFRSLVIDRLQREGGPPVSVLVSGRPRAERLAAATAAAARWPGVLILGDAAGQPLPPELGDCSEREWKWDDVGFQRGTPNAGRGGVRHIRTGGASALLTLDVDATGWRSLRAQGVRHDFVLLPPAAAVTGGARDGDARARPLHLDAATAAGLRVHIGGPERVDLEPLYRWRWGAWAGRMPAATCGSPQSGQQ